jgi:excisionase family DNA binding protein
MTDDHRRPDVPAGADDRPPIARGEELMTVDDVCAWFKVSRDWVYDEVEAERLPYLRLGRKHLRFVRSELLTYLAAAARRRTGPRQRPTWMKGLEPLE